ncbi:MAG TPA: hypothetical protein VFH95_00165 [Candidatus Kapabacteria bacterium]|nr:hypothetical protein [Candidatus Kapabacteria bacterium]
MRSAIFGAASSILLLAYNARAQERAWEFALEVPSFNTYYQENFNNPIDGDAEDIRGNAWDAVQIHPIITYRAWQEFHLPLFLSVEVNIPIVTVKRLEIGDEYEPAGVTDLTQQEQVAHKDLTGRAVIGWEMLPFLQPYAGLVRSRFTSERVGQLDGDETGNLVPDANQDYTETVFSTHLCFGIQGAIPLNANGDVRIRYDAGYEIPQSVFVTNTYFAAEAWGQGTTGYTIDGRVQLDLPFRAVELFADHDGYFTIGGIISKREWNGDGRQGITSYEDYPVNITWPRNFAVEAGGFIGIGMFF